MQFKLRQMEVFRAVVIGGSVTNAAKLLNISQPAVSRMIAHIETSLGLKLFQREKGRLVPTSESLLLVEQIEKVHAAAMEANLFVENLAREMTGELRIGVSSCLGSLVARELVAPFLEEHPQMQVELKTMLLADMPLALLSDSIGLAISVMDLDHANIAVKCLADAQLVLAVPQGHVLDRAGPVDLRLVAEHPLICHSNRIAFGRMVEAAFAAHGLSPRACCVVHHTRDACDLVATGSGIAIIDPYTAEAQADQRIRFLPLSETIPIRPSLCHASLRAPGSELRRMIALAEKKLPPALNARGQGFARIGLNAGRR